MLFHPALVLFAGVTRRQNRYCACDEQCHTEPVSRCGFTVQLWRQTACSFNPCSAARVRRGIRKALKVRDDLAAIPCAVSTTFPVYASAPERLAALPTISQYYSNGLGYPVAVNCKFEAELLIFALAAVLGMESY